MKKVMVIFVVMVVWLVGCGIEGENELYCGDGTMQVGDTCVVAEAENINSESDDDDDIITIKCGEGTTLDEENNECVAIIKDDKGDINEIVCDEGTVLVDGICIPEQDPIICEDNSDCLYSKWGPLCVFSIIDGVSYCQACRQEDRDDNGIDDGCSYELPLCAWGVAGDEGNYFPFYWCIECYDDLDCDDGNIATVDMCNRDTNRCKHDSEICGDEIDNNYNGKIDEGCEEYDELICGELMPEEYCEVESQELIECNELKSGSFYLNGLSKDGFTGRCRTDSLANVTCNGAMEIDIIVNPTLRYINQLAAEVIVGPSNNDLYAWLVIITQDGPYETEVYLPTAGLKDGKLIWQDVEIPDWITEIKRLMIRLIYIPSSDTETPVPVQLQFASDGIEFDGQKGCSDSWTFPQKTSVNLFY